MTRAGVHVSLIAPIGHRVLHLEAVEGAATESAVGIVIVDPVGRRSATGDEVPIAGTVMVPWSNIAGVHRPDGSVR